MSEQKELSVPQRAAVALESVKHEQELIALAKKYADIKEIKNPAGREQAHGAMMELANRRVAITKTGKEARDDATKFSKAVIEEEKRLVALIEPEEGRLRALRDAWDAEREREKQAKLEAERTRVNQIREVIDFFRAYATNAVGMAANKMAAMLETLEAEEITLERFMEFSGEAEAVKAATIDKLREMLAAQQVHEVEQARIAAERAELEKLRAEAAERERQVAAERAAQEARDRAERERIAAEQRAAQDRAEAAMRKQQEEHEARMRAQQAEIDRQQAEIVAERQRQADETARIERERQAAVAAETARIEAEAQAKREAEEAIARAEADRIENERRAAEAERIRREQVEFEANGPEPTEILEVLANNWDVSTDVALHWLTRHAWVALKEVA